MESVADFRHYVGKPFEHLYVAAAVLRMERVEAVRATGLADEIIIEEYQGQKVSDIIKYDIDVLVVGSDWRGKFDYLKNYCDVVYLERTKNISSTKLRSEGVIFNMGIATILKIMTLFRNPNLSAVFM